MRKYGVMLSYPDLYSRGCPNVSASYVLYADTPAAAVQKAFYYALAAVKDMLKRTGTNPYVIDLTAMELITVKSVKEWEVKRNAL